MDIDSRGFSHRVVHPRWFEFQPDLRERISRFASTPEFTAVFAAIMDHAIGYLNFVYLVSRVQAMGSALKVP